MKLQQQHNCLSDRRLTKGPHSCVNDAGVFVVIRKMFPGSWQSRWRWEKEEEAGILPGGLQELVHRNLWEPLLPVMASWACCGWVMLLSLVAVNPPEQKLKNGPTFTGDHKLKLNHWYKINMCSGFIRTESWSICNWAVSCFTDLNFIFLKSVKDKLKTQRRIYRKAVMSLHVSVGKMSYGCGRWCFSDGTRVW